jgi:hypothetical protein
LGARGWTDRVGKAEVRVMHLLRCRVRRFSLTS